MQFILPFHQVFLFYSIKKQITIYDFSQTKTNSQYVDSPKQKMKIKIATENERVCVLICDISSH